MQDFDKMFDKVLGDDLINPTPKQQPQAQPRQVNAQPQVQNKGQVNNGPIKPLDVMICSNVIAKITEMTKLGQVILPEGYNASNELQLAMRDIINSGYLTTARPESIEGSLLEYAIQGLSVAQKQAYFVKFGDQVVMMRSYFGDIVVGKRTNLIKEVVANVIYEGDEIEVDYNDKQELVVVKHKTKFGNQDNEILGAYAYSNNLDGTRTYCVMTKKEIDKNWALSKGANRNTGEVKFQKDFPQEASKRTATRRLMKHIFNTSVASNEYQKAIIASYNRSTKEEYIDADFSEKTTDEMFEKVARNSSSTTIEDDM